MAARTASSPHRAPGSPLATTSAILGASSAGWSPQRSPRKVGLASPDGEGWPSPYGGGSVSGMDATNTPDSPSRIMAHVPEHRANLGHLRSHGLVSNSIFKGGQGDVHQAETNTGLRTLTSPASPHRQTAPLTLASSNPASPGSPSSGPLRMGLGLGISAKRNASTMDGPTTSSHHGDGGSDVENDDQYQGIAPTSPRKSSTFKRLQKANHVSNSPFRRLAPILDGSHADGGGRRTGALDQELEEAFESVARSLSPQALQRSHEQAQAWKTSQQQQEDQEEHDDDDNDDEDDDDQTTPNAALNGSPTSARGLLVSNRLHGPRLMTDTPLGHTTADGTPSQRERRKTVTFDEILDVQEFDRESSFEHESAKSTSSDLYNLSHPAIAAAQDGMTSHGSFEEDEDLDQQMEDNDERNVDHMWRRGDRGADEVVERLMVMNASPDSHSSPAFSTPDLVESGETVAVTKPSSHGMPPQGIAVSHDDNDGSSIDEPVSPASLDDAMPSPTAMASPTRRRPHISRDAVLERVAKEKGLLQHKLNGPLARFEGDQDAGRETRPMQPMRHGASDSPLQDSTTSDQDGTFKPKRRSARGPDPSPPMVAAPPRRAEALAISQYRTSSPLDQLTSQLDAEVAHEGQTQPSAAASEARMTSPRSSPMPLLVPVVDQDAAGPLHTTTLDHADGFETNLRRELSRIYHESGAKYTVKDRGTFTSTVEAPTGSTASASTTEQTAAEARTGSAATTSASLTPASANQKAWRRLRRPSDMNEYAEQVRAHRAREDPKQTSGKVFVMVDSFTPASQMPIPSRPSRFYCVLDNGLHVVRTATAGLRGQGQASRVGQEFELIQHRDLTFSLTLVLQRDAHLQEPSASGQQLQASPSSPVRRDRLTPSFSRGMGKLFSSPKKVREGGGRAGSTASMLEGGAGLYDPLLAFCNREGALGQCRIVFDGEVAQRCRARCEVMELPLVGVAETATEEGEQASTNRLAPLAAEFARNLPQVRGTLRLKLFYLPPLPGLPRSALPQSLSECIEGIRAARWHAGQPWMEGVLTQMGGDCPSWRRRPVKVQGAHLIGYNEITKRPTVKIDLTKAVQVEQNHDPHRRNRIEAANEDDLDEYDETYHVERSFRLTFQDGERIFFFADTDEEMHRWMAALAKIVGNDRIPPVCPWAQMVLNTEVADKA